MLWFNEYERHARAAPGLFALLPIAVVATAFGLRNNPAISAITGLVVAAGGPLVLANFVRARGLAIEAELYRRWGGRPTTSLLLLSVPSENTALRDRRRENLTQVTGVALLDRAAENQDPARAADVVEAAVASLRTKTRDKQRFELLFAENKGYGFERNLLGLRPIGMFVSVVCLVAAVVLLILTATDTIDSGVPELSVAIALCAALVGVWIGYPSAVRVRQAAGKYADALLDAASAL